MVLRYKNLRRAVSAAFAVMSMFGISHAGSSPLSASDYFETLDANADGVLSGREATDLKVLDADQDGELTKTEFSEAVAEHSQKSFSANSEVFVQRDGNEDGRLSGKEISGFEFTDSDSNGKIPLEEFLLSLTKQRRELSSRSPAEIRKVATERFTALDTTEDGRLSGTEVVGSTHLDFNRDKRVTQEEFIAGMILDAATANQAESPKSDSRSHELLNLFVKAINDQDSGPLFQNMRPELISIVDAPVLNFSLKQLHDRHHTAKAIKPDLVQQSPPEANGQFDAVAPIKCASGEIKVHITVYEGQLLGLRFDSPAIAEVEDNIYAKLMTDEKTQDEFAEYYSSVCKTLIEHLVASKNDDAASMFHPEVIQQIGRDKFDGVFDAIRNSLGEVKLVELETIGAVENENGVFMMTIGHRVTGSAGTLMIENKFQFQGMEAALVAISSTPVEPDMINLLKPVATKPRSPLLKEFDAKQDGVKFLMPGKPVRTFDEAQNMAMWRLEHPSSQAVFTLQIFTFAQGFENASDDFFTGLNDTLVSTTGGTIVETAKEQWNGHPAQFILIKVDGKGFMARFDIVVGLKVYSMQWQGQQINDDIRHSFAEPFLKSLQIVEEPSDVVTPEVISDDDLPVAVPAPVP